MERKHLMIAVDWYGPYTMEEANWDAFANYGSGLYVCIGKCKYERKNAIQYIGIGKELWKRIKPDHHKMRLVVKQQQIWLGEVSTAEPSGTKLKVTKATLDYAEWMHARFMRLPLNEQKTKTLPPRSVTVLNRWFRSSDYTIRNNRPHPDWPDLLDYPAHELPARAVWFGSRQRRFLHSDGYARPD